MMIFISRVFAYWRLCVRCQNLLPALSCKLLECLSVFARRLLHHDVCHLDTFLSFQAFPGQPVAEVLLCSRHQHIASLHSVGCRLCDSPCQNCLAFLRPCTCPQARSASYQASKPHRLIRPHLSSRRDRTRISYQQ